MLHRLPWSHLTSVHVSEIVIQIPSNNNDILSSLSHIQSLTVCRLRIEADGRPEDIEEMALELPYGFLSLKELHLSWDNSQSSYHFVECLIRSILSGDLDKVTLHLPLSSHSTSLPSDWIGNIFDALSIHPILHLIIDYCHINPVPQTNKPFIQGFLLPHAMQGLFDLSSIRSISFIGIETDWNQSLAFKMAKSWSKVQTISFATYNKGDPSSGLRTEAGHYMDIRDLVHFAKYCVHLEHISLPLSSVFQFGADIAVRYKLNAKNGNHIFINDQNTYSINNLATATFLYGLFGRGIRTQLRLGHSLYRALRVYGEGFGGQPVKTLDYNIWMLKGPTDPFYDDHLSSPFEDDWYEKGYRLLQDMSGDEVDDVDIVLETKGDSEVDDMQTDSEEDIGSQFSVEI